MKKFKSIFPFLLIGILAIYLFGANVDNYFTKPASGSTDNALYLNGTWYVDDVSVTATGTELNLTDGLTATTAELNALDGITSTVAELNILDGVTSTAAELNILDGVTSTAAELNLLDGVTSSTAELNLLDDGLDRSDFDEEALQIYGIPINNFRAADAAVMGISETAGDHYLMLGTNTIILASEVANNETETSVSYTQFIIPPEYVSAGDVKIRIKHWVGGDGTSNNSTVDFSVYEQDGNGAVGADLVTTSATVTTEDSWTTTDFVVTASGLVAGDILIIKFTSAVIENASSNIQGKYDGFAVLLDIKG